MSEIIETTCNGCGEDLSLEITGTNSRWLKAMARMVRCDTCSEEMDQETAKRERHEAKEARRSRSQLPNRLRGETLDQFAQKAKATQTEAIDAAVDWVNPNSYLVGLMLTGPTGTGKTRIAAAACWSYLEHAPCSYVSVASAMSRLSMRLTDEGRQEAVRFFHGVGAVVLDDLDKCRASDYGKEQLFTAVDAREQAGSPVLVTTNLTPSEIAERFGEPLASRLAGYCETVEVGGVDLRVTA